jgi:hypothetical protein
MSADAKAHYSSVDGVHQRTNPYRENNSISTNNNNDDDGNDDGNDFWFYENINII